MTCNRQEAEDLTQEVFLNAYKSLNRFRLESKLSTWLYRIAINHCFNQQAKKKRQRWLSLDFISDLDIDQNPALLHSANNRPDTVLEQKETELIIQKCINSLPRQQRIAIILNRYEGCTYQEIANVMQCSVASVESRLFRAKQNLYRKLRPYLKHL
jgi:RNA polymerase sigma-70 factor (ECF subfamily)